MIPYKYDSCQKQCQLAISVSIPTPMLNAKCEKPNAKSQMLKVNSQMPKAQMHKCQVSIVERQMHNCTNAMHKSQQSNATSQYQCAMICTPQCPHLFSIAATALAVFLSRGMCRYAMGGNVVRLPALSPLAMPLPADIWMPTPAMLNLSPLGRVTATGMREAKEPPEEAPKM